MEKLNGEKDIPPDGSSSKSATRVPPFSEREAYFAALQKWIYEAQSWQSSIPCVPYLLFSQPDWFGAMPPPTTGFMSEPPRRRGGGGGGPRFNFAWPTPPQAVPRTPPNPPGGLRYRVPPYWKRFCAEVVDSMITFVLKLVITFLAIHIFGFIDLDKYSIEMLQQNVQSLTYKVAVEMTSQLLVLELINRIVVCALEAYWLKGGEGNRIGGSSPGKNLFGLKVVLCYHAVPVPGQPNDVVAVTPGTDLGWGWSIIRAMSKNIFLALIYPLCFAFFFFKFNRLGYDVLSHSIVVENVDHNNNRR